MTYNLIEQKDGIKKAWATSVCMETGMKRHMKYLDVNEH